MTKLHALIGTQFGDLEYDVGKSVRWTQYFADDMFILDINLGNTRYYVVDWQNTFPQAESRVAAIDFFTKPVEFRKKQYELAKGIWDIQPDDWVLFVDAHEGLNIDTRVDPPDWAEEPFKSYLTAITDAATGPTVRLPLLVYLSDGDIYSVEYDNTTIDPATGEVVVFVSGADAAVPFYMDDDSGSLVRLVKASELDKPAFNWASIDTLGAVGSADTTDISIISYGYAHWHLEDILPGQTAPPPMTAANDDGWRMRNLLTKVRPIPGLPVGTTWQPPTTDPAGVPGPDLSTHIYAAPDITTPPPTVPPNEVASLLTPLYDAVFRFGLRDGLVWKGSDGSDALGNIPMSWDYDLQQWVPRVPPEQWVDAGYPQGA